MNTTTSLIRAAFIVTAASALLVNQPATARERQTTISGANGKTAVRDIHRSQGDSSSTTTGPNGKTASRQVDRSASGATATVTGPNGKSVQRQTSVTTSK